MVAARNPEIRYSRLGVEVAAYLSSAEASLYETVLYGSAVGDDVDRQRTIEERVSSAASLSVLNERSQSYEAGLKQRLPTAGEMSLAYKVVRRSNNIIASSTNNLQDTEWTSGLVVTLKQPLLRNAGRGVLETDRRVAELEREVQWAQFRQQVLKSTADALNLYWQLQRAQEARRLRDESMNNVQKMAQDVDARIEAGRTPPAARLEVQSILAGREAELLRADLAEHEAEAKVLTALGIPSTGPALHLKATDTPLPPNAQPEPLDEALQRALDQWPPYRVSQLRLEQGRLRLAFADNQRQPQLDFSATYNATGLAYDRIEAKKLATRDQYPEWTLGLNFEMPLGGNGKAGGQYQAQAVRVQQNLLELEAIRTSLSNDLSQRREDLVSALRQVAQAQKDVDLRKQVEDNERDRYRLGVGLLRNWLDRENETYEARQRLSDAVMRAQSARVAWQFAQGSLLDEYDIALRSE
nr:TolC family protein [Ramlibacter agri]